MELNDLIQDYLGDKDEGLKSLVTLLLSTYSTLRIFSHQFLPGFMK